MHSLGYENEEEGETEGGNDRETEELHTLRHGQTVRFLSLYRLGRNALPSPSQIGYRISTQGENPDSCFISVFKFGSNIGQTFFLPLSPALSLFSVSHPWRSEVVWLVNPRRPRLIALCITPQEKETDLQTDKEREKPGRKNGMRK